MPRQTLGRGLSALMGEEKQPTAAATAVQDATQSMPSSAAEIDIDLIEPNPEQPRTHFDTTELDALAASIRSNGIVQPIVVRKRGERYQIVAGERRWRAAQRAELRKVPVSVRDIPDDRLLEIALIENIQRQELNPIEEANAYQKLIYSVGLTQEQISDRVGKERSLITTSVRLLRLPDEIQRLMVTGKLSLSHGRALLLTDDQSVQRQVGLEIAEHGLSVRDTEKRIKSAAKKKLQGTDGKEVTSTVDPNVKAAETKLMRKLSTNVKILPAKKGGGGKIELEYYGTDDLDRIFQLLIK